MPTTKPEKRLVLVENVGDVVRKGREDRGGGEFNIEVD